MRRFLTLLFFVLVACLAPTTQARNIALLIGVDEYESVHSLKNCVNDAISLKEALMKIGFEEKDIQVLVTGGSFKSYPTKKRIEKALTDLVSSAAPADFVFIAFSGQGFQNGKDASICPADTELDELEETTISIAKILNTLSRGQAKKNLIVIDACRNQVEFSHRGIHSLTTELEFIPQSSSSQQIVLFQSCSAGEVSFEDTSDKKGNGYFTKNLVEALSGKADCNRDGRLTLLEVFTWTANQTQLQVHDFNKEHQSPSLSATDISDFTLFENLNVPKANALAEEAQNAMDAGNYALAVEKYDSAIALYPDVNSWKREREFAKKMVELQKQEIKSSLYRMIPH